MKLTGSIVDYIGKTPLVKLEGIMKKFSLNFEFFAKCEMFNPAGSVKDRLAHALVLDAIEKGILGSNPENNSNKLWVEPTSGNTGIGLAFLSRIFGFRLLLTMPENMSKERQLLLAYLGAEVLLTPASKGMKGAVDAANEIEKEFGAYQPGQFTNPANPRYHYNTTGPEIWKQLDGKIDVFVAGSGTGGTISGAGRFLKEKKKNVKVILVEPEESPVISEGRSGKHGIQGIGPGFIPKTLDLSVIDEVIRVTTEEAVEFSQLLSKYDGILGGISSGAVIASCIKLKEKHDLSGKTVVTVLPDTGERYLSTELFRRNEVLKRIMYYEDWRAKNE